MKKASDVPRVFVVFVSIFLTMMLYNVFAAEAQQTNLNKDGYQVLKPPVPIEPPVMPKSSRNPQLNEHGDVVWEGYDGHDLEIFLYSNGTITQITDNEYDDYSPRMNSKGQIVPQEFVVCTGWHALCTASTDCKMNGDKANCDCLRVNETHIVATTEIQDTAVKRLTLAKCTNKHPCDVDQAPVCKAIKYGQYKVDNVKYDWVSTYSYRGWCSLLERELKPCDQHAIGYTGDLYWAVCDAAPCTENQNPSDPDRPLSCQCRVEDTPFVGTNGSCTGDNGGIMSSSPLGAWDFQNNTWRIPLPGYEYVQGACAPLESDPLPPR